MRLLHVPGGFKAADDQLDRIHVHFRVKTVGFAVGGEVFLAEFHEAAGGCCFQRAGGSSCIRSRVGADLGLLLPNIRYLRCCLYSSMPDNYMQRSGIFQEKL